MGSLAQEFIAGLHPPQPSEENCRYCELQHLCRCLHQATDDDADSDLSENK